MLFAATRWETPNERTAYM